MHIDASPTVPSVAEEIGVGVLWIELDGLREVRQGFVPQLLTQVGVTAPVPVLPTIRLQRDGLGVLDDGRLPLASTTVKLPELVRVVSHLGVCGREFFEVLY